MAWSLPVQAHGQPQLQFPLASRTSSSSGRCSKSTRSIIMTLSGLRVADMVFLKKYRLSQERSTPRFQDDSRLSCNDSACRALSSCREFAPRWTRRGERAVIVSRIRLTGHGHVRAREPLSRKNKRGSTSGRKPKSVELHGRGASHSVSGRPFPTRNEAGVPAGVDIGLVHFFPTIRIRSISGSPPIRCRRAGAPGRLRDGGPDRASPCGARSSRCGTGS